MLAMQGIDIAINGEYLKAKVERIKIYKNGTQSDFATLDDARQANC